MEKKSTWTRKRHRVITFLARPVAMLLVKIGYHAKVKRFKEKGKQNYLILSNHQTDFDQFFISVAFRNPVYYVAMEDIFSNGFISKLLRWLIAPIPILKAATDLNAIRACFKVAKEGGCIALFPEGNRTYSGRTCYIKPSVAALAKKLGLPIAFFKIEGGYGVKPRWADHTRKGSLSAGVSYVLEPEEYKNMTKEELYDLIVRELWVDETEDTREFPGKRIAEGLERVLYICPDCGITEFDTAEDVVSCRRCGQQYRYLPNKCFKALKGMSPFRHVADWYEYQEAFIRKLDLTPYRDEAVFHDMADVYEVIVFDRKQQIKNDVPIRIFSDRLEFDAIELPSEMLYSDIKAMACIAGHKLNIFYRDRIYQLRGGKRFNALKYCNIYYHAKFVSGQHEAGEFEFLGL